MDNSDSASASSYTYNGKVMLCSSIILFLLVIIMIFFRTCIIHWFHRRRHRLLSRSISTTSPHNNGPLYSSANNGLDPSTLKSLPAFTYFPTSITTHHPSRLECAVCLSDFEDHDKARFLPNCHHTFHIHCIDTWFRSHSTCPLCRAPVHPLKTPTSTSMSVNEQPSSGSDQTHRESEVGCSSLPPPIGCRKKPLHMLASIIVEEVPAVGDNIRESRGPERIGVSVTGTGDHGSKLPSESDSRILSWKRMWST